MVKLDLKILNLKQLGLFGKMEGKESKYTPEGLPVVCEDIVDMYIRDLQKRVNEGSESVFDYASEKMNQILKKENSNFVKLLKHFKEKEYPTPCHFNAFCFGLFSAYELLKTQAETNKLEEEIN